MNRGRLLSLIGLIFNILGVILLFFATKPYKDFPIGAQTTRKNTGFLMIINSFCLRGGLFLVIIGNVFQIFGLLML